MSRSDRFALIGVFLLCLSVYLLTANGRIVHRDGEAVYQVARSLLDHGWFDVPLESVFLEYQGPGTQGGSKIDLAQNTASLGVDRRAYAKYGVGLSVASIPLLLGARAAQAWLPTVPVEILERAFVPLVNAFATAGTAALLAWIARRLGYPIATGVGAACLYGLATFAWAHARNYYGEPLTGLLITAAFGLALIGPNPGMKTGGSGIGRTALAGTALGLAMLVRPTAVLVLPALLGMIWTTHPGPNRRRALVVAVPMLAAVVVTGWYDVARFGDPFDFGYRGDGFGTGLLSGLYGLLLSPGKGVLWYAPVIFLALPGWVIWLRRPGLRPIAIWLMMAVAVWLGVHSTFDFWEGGWTWGPRLLLPLLPISCLPVVETLSRLVSRRLRYAGAAAVTLLVLLQLPPAVSDYTRYYWSSYLTYGPSDYEMLVYRPSGSPVIRQWDEAIQVLANALTPGQLAGIRQETLSVVASAGGEPAARHSVALLDRSALNGINVPDLWMVHLWLFGAETIPLAIGAGSCALLLLAGVWFLGASASGLAGGGAVGRPSWRPDPASG